MLFYMQQFSVQNQNIHIVIPRLKNLQLVQNKVTQNMFVLFVMTVMLMTM